MKGRQKSPSVVLSMVTPCQWMPVRLTVVSIAAGYAHRVMRNEVERRKGPGQTNRKNAADKLPFHSNNRVA